MLDFMKTKAFPRPTKLPPYWTDPIFDMPDWYFVVAQSATDSHKVGLDGLSPSATTNTVYILTNREIYGLAKIIAVYSDLDKAEKHLKSLNDKEDFFDDNNYFIETHNVF